MGVGGIQDVVSDQSFEVPTLPCRSCAIEESFLEGQVVVLRCLEMNPLGTVEQGHQGVVARLDDPLPEQFT